MNLPGHCNSVTLSPQESEARLARTDPLTGLPNRLALEEYLPLALEQAMQRQQVMAVGIIDMDDFKSLNDSLGREKGDAVLTELTLRLKSNLGEENFLAACRT